jgi:hypothetical protein
MTIILISTFVLVFVILVMLLIDFYYVNRVYDCRYKFAVLVFLLYSVCWMICLIVAVPHVMRGN